MSGGPMTARYRQIATDLREAIASGQYLPGALLPSIADLAPRFDVSSVTIRAAISVLEAEGLVRAIHGRGTEVLDRRAVPVRLSRYGAVLRPGGQLGPWETACERAGVTGDMVPLDVEQVAAPEDVASELGLAAGDLVVRRDRHANIDGQAVQLHTAWYPLALVAETPIATPGKVVGGIYAALKAAGLDPASADETVTARPATAEEAAELRIREGAPVLAISRVTKDAAGRALELLRMVADPSRSQLVYDDLPLSR